MNIQVRFHGLEASDALREHAERRIHLHLGWLGRGVETVVVTIGDLNGPRGGLDKRCRITVRGPAVGTTTLDDTSSDAYTAVDLAVGRIAHAVARLAERAREARGERPRAS